MSENDETATTETDPAVSFDRDTPRTRAENAELALLLEVAGTPKPGNVDRHRDLTDLRFEHFLAGAVGARRGLVLADDVPVGEAFERAVWGMSHQQGGNTQFGCLLLLVPLVRASAAGDLSREGVRDVVEATTVEDAEHFYQAFEHVDVAVEDPPEDATDLDVRRGSDAIPALRERGLTLYDVMDLGSEQDGNAREWVGGFERSFRAAHDMLADDGPAPDRVARAFLDLLGEEPDTLVRTQHGEAVAEEVRQRAAEIGRDLDAAADLADDLVAEGYNPGTTADIAAAATFIALERGMPV